MDVEHTADRISELTECLEDALHQARRDLHEGSYEDFVDHKVSKLFGVVKAYCNCFTRLKLKTRDEMHRSLEKKFRHREIQERVEHLEEVEREWDTFLKDVDKSMYKDETAALSLGDTGPVKVALTEAGGRVLVVSFGGQTGAKQWLEDTGCHFDMLLDPNRQVWCIEAVVYYAEQQAAGVPPITPYKNVEDDPHQMGGDFIMDRAGLIQLSYCSKTSADRPSIQLLVDTLKNLTEVISDSVPS